MSEVNQEFYKQAIERARAMTHEETIAALKKAGILDENGELTERYRPPEEAPVANATQE